MRGIGKRLLALSLAVFLLAGNLPVRAAEPELPPEEASGYLFALRPGAAMRRTRSAAPASGVEPVSAAHGVYRADTLAEVYAFTSEAYLEYVTPDYAMQSHAVPNDPGYTGGNAWHLGMLDMDYAWEKGVTGADVRLGIVDSGVNRNHEDFVGAAVRPGAYFPQGSDTGYTPGTQDPTDPNDPTKPANAHGTFVAGLIAAAANNGKGTAGVAPGVELVPLVAFAGGTTYLSAVVKAIYASVDVPEYRCDVLNMSLGIYKDKPLSNGSFPNIMALDRAVAYAHENGVILVASSGNDYGTMLSYPAAYDCVIGVGAVRKDGTRAAFSQYNASVDVAAPGEGVYSLSYSSNTEYSTGSGTSYAAPQVAAAAALALEIDPTLTPARLTQLMEATAKDAGPAGRDDQYGYGLLDVSAFLRAVANQVELRAAPGGVEVTARYRLLSGEKGVTLWAAAYDKNGRMVDAASYIGAADKSGAVDADTLYLDTTAGAELVRVFLWDTATGVPLGEPTERSLK